MTDEQKCIADLFTLIGEIAENSKKKDFSLFRTSGIGGCDKYHGLPPIFRRRDDLLLKYEDVICSALKAKEAGEENYKK